MLDKRITNTILLSLAIKEHRCEPEENARVSWEGVGMQPLRTLPKTVEADYYNRIRLAVLRTTTPPLRFIPRNMPLLEVLLEDHQWLCLDGAFTGLPLLQWTDFQTQHRTGLQEPVRCVLHLYQPQAGLLMGRALEAINAHLKAAENPPFSG